MDSFGSRTVLNLGQFGTWDSLELVQSFKFGRKIILNEVKSWNGIKTVPDTKISRS